MTERERLIDILSTTIYPRIGADPTDVVVDFLLDNGVIVPPAKLGDTVFIIDEYHGKGKSVCETKVFLVRKYADMQTTRLIICVDDPWNPRRSKCRDANEIYLTREEAEKALAALKERESNGTS